MKVKISLSDLRKPLSIPGSGTGTSTRAERELLDLTARKMAEDPKLQYHDALKLVASERRDLDMQYTAEVRGGR
jgi:hypothetical protein